MHLIYYNANLTLLFIAFKKQEMQLQQLNK